jgi:hypothetical protein
MADPINPNAVVDSAADVAKAAVASGKSFLKSKTFWANVLVAGTAYLGYVPASVAPYSIYIITGLNVLLRYLTNQPINLSLPKVTVS